MTEEVQGFPIDWEDQPAARNYFAALAGKRTAHSSTILVADVVVAADSCMQADSAAYHTNSKAEANQGGHQVVAAAAAAEDFRTGCAKRDFAVVRIGSAEADRIQLAAALADFRIDLVDHPEGVVHTADAEEDPGGVEDLVGDHTDCGHTVVAVGVETDLEHLACGERSVEDSS